MNNLSLKERMALKTQERKKEPETKVQEGGNNLLLSYSNIQLENKFFAEELNNEELNFLNQKSIELFSIQANARLNLGKVFTEVHGKMAGKSKYDGIYVKWLEYNGFNKMTALRHRERYSLFSLITNKECKSAIATISQKQIKMLLEKKEEYISEINNKGIRYLETLLTGNNLLPVNKMKNDTFIEKEYDILVHSFNFNKEKLKNLEDDKKQKVFKILSELKKIIEE